MVGVVSDRRSGARPVWNDPITRRFLVSQGVGQAADAATALVLARVLVEGPDGGVAPDALLQTLAVAAVPYAVVGPVAGVVADRWSRRRSLGALHLFRAVTTIVLLGVMAGGHRTDGLVLAALLLGAARLVYAVRAAALPWIAPSGHLVHTDAAALYVGMVAVIVGGGVGGLAAGRFDATVLLVATTAHLAAAVGFGTLPRDLGGRSTRVEVAWSCVLRRVVRLTTSSPTRFVIAVTTSSRALLGASFATFVLLASEEYGLGPDGYLLALAVTGAGSFLGAALAPRSHERMGPAGVVGAAFVVPAVVLSIAGPLERQLVIEAALLVSFCSFQILRVVADATVQEHIDDDTRGRVFATYDVSYNLSYFGGAAAAITFGAAGRAAAWFVTIGISYAVLVVVLWAVRRSLHPHRTPNDDVPRPGRRSADPPMIPAERTA